MSRSAFSLPNVYSAVFGLVFAVTPLVLVWLFPVGGPVALLSAVALGIAAAAGVWRSERLRRAGTRWHRLSKRPTESARAALAFGVPVGLLFSVTNTLLDAEQSRPTPRLVAVSVLTVSVLMVGVVGLRSLWRQIR